MSANRSRSGRPFCRCGRTTWAPAKLCAWFSKRSMLKIVCRITFGSSQGDSGITRPNILRESAIETFQCPDQAEPPLTAAHEALRPVVSGHLCGGRSQKRHAATAGASNQLQEVTTISVAAFVRRAAVVVSSHDQKRLFSLVEACVTSVELEDPSCMDVRQTNCIDT